jgi:hypothetical protein
MRPKLTLAITILIGGLLAVSAQAGPIALANPGFDLDSTTNFGIGGVTGWDANPTEYGYWNTTVAPGTTQALAPLSLPNVLFISTIPGVGGGNLDGYASQATAVAVVPGVTYTFSIYAAKRLDLIQPVAFVLQLFDGTGNAFATQVNAASSLSSASWTEYTVTGAAPLTATGNIGVRISLDSTGMVLPGGNQWVNKFQVLFDNASLIDSQVPEPLTMLFVGEGLAILGLLRRRR